MSKTIFLALGENFPMIFTKIYAKWTCKCNICQQIMPYQDFFFQCDNWNEINKRIARVKKVFKYSKD